MVAHRRYTPGSGAGVDIMASEAGFEWDDPLECESWEPLEQWTFRPPAFPTCTVCGALKHLTEAFVGE